MKFCSLSSQKLAIKRFTLIKQELNSFDTQDIQDRNACILSNKDTLLWFQPKQYVSCFIPQNSSYLKSI